MAECFFFPLRLYVQWHNDIQAFLPSTRGCRIYALKTWQKLRRWTLSCAVLSSGWVNWAGVNPYALCSFMHSKQVQQWYNIVTWSHLRGIVYQRCIHKICRKTKFSSLLLSLHVGMSWLSYHSGPRYTYLFECETAGKMLPLKCLGMEWVLQKLRRSDIVRRCFILQVEWFLVCVSNSLVPPCRNGTLMNYFWNLVYIFNS
jgi:hypothetical protein